MSNQAMGSENLQILRHLAVRGERTILQLMEVVRESRPAINIRLATMESLGWLQKSVNQHEARVWRVDPDAYAKLASVGIYATPPAPKRSRVIPVHQAPQTGEVVQPRRFNIYQAPILKSSGMEAPVRAGSMDFKAYPSRGFSC